VKVTVAIADQQLPNALLDLEEELAIQRLLAGAELRTLLLEGTRSLLQLAHIPNHSHNMLTPSEIDNSAFRLGAYPL
jgi:hypothetical protein